MCYIFLSLDIHQNHCDSFLFGCSVRVLFWVFQNLSASLLWFLDFVLNKQLYGHFSGHFSWSKMVCCNRGICMQVLSCLNEKVTKLNETQLVEIESSFFVILDLRHSSLQNNLTTTMVHLVAVLELFII